MDSLFTVDEVKKDLFRILKNSPSTYRLPNFDGSEKEKFLLLNSLYFQNHQYVITIKKLIKEKSAFQIGSIARLIFENVVNMALIYCYPIDKGVIRFKLYADYEEYRTILEYDKLKKGLSQILYLEETIITKKENHDKFVNLYGESLNNWSGKSIKESCLILDRDYSNIFIVPNLFTIQYLQAYKFLSRTVHSNPNSMINVASERFSFFRKGYIYTYDGLDNFVLYIHYTLIGWLLTIKIFNHLFGNLDNLDFINSEIYKHCGLITNNIDKRNKVIEELGVRKQYK